MMTAMNRNGLTTYAALLAITWGLGCGVGGTARAAPPSGDGAVFEEPFHSVRVEADDRFDSGRITVATWVKLESHRQPQVLLNRGERGELITLYLYKDRLRMLVEHGEGGEYAYATADPPPLGKWTHVAGTYDGGHIAIYINGRLIDRAGAAGEIPVREDPLWIGARLPWRDTLDGALADVRVYGSALNAEQVEAVYDGKDPAASEVVVQRTAAELTRQMRTDDTPPDGFFPLFASGTLPTADGFRGIWYANQPSGDEYKYKYSGGLATYPQQHHPIAIHSEEANKTFFVYGGRNEHRNQLLHMISYYDHDTGRVARPRILLDKQTDDAHDNPTLQIDGEGYLWIFSNAHGTGRPSYIHRSRKPYSIEAFDRVRETNFSYGQPSYLEGQGFVFLHTLYAGGRVLHVSRSRDGEEWTEPRPLAKVDEGHYQISNVHDGVIGTAFNYHPEGKGLNHRTNLYYMESRDGGRTWRNVQGEELDLPLVEPNNAALAVEYESKGRLVYLKDIQYTADGRPVVLYLTSGHWRSGPDSGPRVFTLAEWTGTEWRTREITDHADNNYDFASLYIESDETWRLIGTTEPGPQRYNTGGEMAMWLSEDAGRTWELAEQLTEDSRLNHTYPRRPVHAHPDFYALWADGHGRQPSESRLYFTSKGGEVFRLPVKMNGEAADPEPLR